MNAAYKVIVSRLGQDAYGVQKADIEFIAADSHCVYSITACSYTALSSDGRTVSTP